MLQIFTIPTLSLNKMASLNWSLITLTALLSLAISSAHRVKPAQMVAGPIIVYSDPEPVPAGPPNSPTRPPAPGAQSEYGPVPVPHGLITSEPTKVWPVPAGPVPVRSGPITSEPGKVWPVPAMEDEPSAQPPADSPLPSANGDVADNEIGPNCCGGSGWGCGGGGGGGGANPCPGYGCGGCPPPAPKNPYYCQPAANCVGTPGYGSGAGFTIYLDDHFPSSSPPSDDEQQH